MSSDEFLHRLMLIEQGLKELLDDIDIFKFEVEKLTEQSSANRKL